MDLKRPSNRICDIKRKEELAMLIKKQESELMKILENQQKMEIELKAIVEMKINRNKECIAYINRLKMDFNKDLEKSKSLAVTSISTTIPHTFIDTSIVVDAITLKNKLEQRKKELIKIYQLYSKMEFEKSIPIQNLTPIQSLLQIENDMLLKNIAIYKEYNAIFSKIN